MRAEGSVQATPDFTEQPQALKGASHLITALPAFTPVGGYLVMARALTSSSSMRPFMATEKPPLP